MHAREIEKVHPKILYMKTAFLKKPKSQQPLKGCKVSLNSRGFVYNIVTSSKTNNVIMASHYVFAEGRRSSVPIIYVRGTHYEIGYDIVSDCF